MSIEQMRKAYERDGLRKTDIDPDPMVQFRRWFDAACQPDVPDWFEVNAMTLSTSDRAGAVTSRIVLLKGIEQGHLYFFTNYESEKGIQIAENPQVSLCFFWPHLERQVRIDGTATKTGPEQSERYFHARPRPSQFGALVSRQSTELAGRDELDRAGREVATAVRGPGGSAARLLGLGTRSRHRGSSSGRGRPARLHDRIAYRKRDEAWDITRLSP